MVDERLALAASLYEPCRLGADIGTDHGYLPCHLLQSNICERMLLCDVSPKALAHAENSVAQQHLQERAALHCVDGLDAITEKCGCISITGMGGETMAGILLNGRSRLQDAVLVLSAHTEPEQVRRAVMKLDYHFTAEKLCFCAGRFYLIWRAEPGAVRMTEDEIEFGTALLMQNEKKLLTDYLSHRIHVEKRRLDGLCSAAAVNEEAQADAARRMKHWEDMLHEAQGNA